MKLAALFALHDAHVTTVEGVGSCRDPHLVQTQIASFHGSQCGFCTPGMVMSLCNFTGNLPLLAIAIYGPCFDRLIVVTDTQLAQPDGPRT